MGVIMILILGEGGSHKKIYSALWASFGSKNKGAGPPGPSPRSATDNDYILLTFKCRLNSINFLKAKVCHEELWLPCRIPVTEDAKSFFDGRCCFILRDKGAHHYIVNICLHHKEEERKLIPHCLVSGI